MKNLNLPPEKKQELTDLLLKHTPSELALKVLQLTNLLKHNTDLLVEKNAELGRKDEEIAKLHARAAISSASRN
jgi:hypothetical protein